MTIPPSFLDEIRARVPVSDVVGRKVKLIRAGREMKACCPFHNEKTPSFYVNDDKGFYHCFGCGAHGDVIGFMIDGEGMEFRDAVATLAVEAGLQLPEESPEARDRAKAAQGLHDVAGRAADWFAAQLHGTAGSGARRYLEDRGLTGDTVRTFALGFAPDKRGALENAIDAPAEKLVAAGLLIRRDEGGREPYPRFRDRLMFPIRDTRGRTVGFGGRILGSGEPKYLNSPDGPLFDKGRLLYNLDRAGPAARKSGRLAVVEGYMDVIALAQAGFAEAVAPMGTALTEDQLRLSWRAAPEPVLCFDGDAAGIRAAHRAAERALPLLSPGKSLRFVLLPEGKDPDDLVRAGGLSAFEKLVENAESLIDHLWRLETEGVDMATPERRAAVRQRLFGHTAAIADEGIAQLYRGEFKRRFDALFAPSAKARGPDRRGYPNRRFAPQGASPLARASAQRSLYGVYLRAIFVGLLRNPQLLHDADEELAELPIRDPDLARLRSAIFSALSGNPELDIEGLRTDLREHGLGQLAEDIVRQNSLDFSFTRLPPKAANAEEQADCILAAEQQAAQAAEDLASVSAQLIALERLDREEADLRARYDSLTEEDFARRSALTKEKLRLEQELRALAQGRRQDDPL